MLKEFWKPSSTVNPLLLQAPRDKYVLGGVHMTDPANLITFMLKVLCWDDSVVSNE